MNTQNLLAELTRYDATLVRTGDGLKVQAPEPLPAEFMARLRVHKPELLRLLGERQTLTNYGAGHPDAPPPEPMPRPVEPWPADLNTLLRRVSTAFEWSDQDRRDFIQWARRDQRGIDDACVFLEAEAAKLPVPGLTDRRRVVLDMLRADSSLRIAWTCADDGTDPVTLTLAIRDAGTCELGIPREKFDALALPMLIDELTRGTA